MMTASTATATVAPGPEDEAARPGMVTGAVRTWLRIEGLAAFAAGVGLFGMTGAPWLLAVPLILVPDVSAVGYLAGPRVGAFAYNLVHTWAAGLLLLALGLSSGVPAVEVVGAILIAHVGMDRAVGYGLKLPTAFQDTHLGRIGRLRA